MSLSQVVFSKFGSTNSEFSSMADNGFVKLTSNALGVGLGASERAYFQLQTAIPSFLMAILKRAFFQSDGVRAHKINISAIVDTDLNLSNVDWDNQDDLTYEDFPGLNPILSYTSPNSSNVPSDKVDMDTLIPFKTRALFSGKLIYGFRLMVDDDLGYSGADRCRNATTGATAFQVWDKCKG